MQTPAAKRSPRLLALLVVCGLVYGTAMVASGLHLGVFMRTALQLNYQTMGFLKRALVGTLIHALGLVPNSETSLRSLAIAYGVLAGLALCLPAALLMRRFWNLWPCLGFLLSPAGLIQFGANYNLFDGSCAALFLTQILLLPDTSLAASQPRPMRPALSAGLIGLVGALALLVHELYALAFLPLLLRLSIPQLPRRQWWILLTPITLTLAMLQLHGRYEPGAAALINRLGPGTSTLELTSSLGNNLEHTMRELWLSGLWRFSLPGFLFLLLAVAIALLSNRPQGGGQAGMSRAGIDILVACSPMLLGIIGVDINRWVALSVFNVMLLWLIGRIRIGLQPRWLAASLVPLLALAGPVGVNGLAFPRLTGPLYEHYLSTKAEPPSTP